MDLAQQAIVLDTRARHHKREAGRHKQAARDCRERQAKVEAECRRLGIEVTYSTAKGTHHGGATTGHHDAD